MISPELWEEFRKHRRRLRKPMTEYAEMLLRRKLERFEAMGHDPVALLETAIECGWQTVYEPRAPKTNGHDPGPPWWSTDKGIEAEAKRMGMSPRPGETWNDLKGRIYEKRGNQ